MSVGDVETPIVRFCKAQVFAMSEETQDKISKFLRTCTELKSKFLDAANELLGGLRTLVEMGSAISREKDPSTGGAGLVELTRLLQNAENSPTCIQEFENINNLYGMLKSIWKKLHRIGIQMV